MARCLIGVVFAVAAFTKLRSGPAFRAFLAWVATLPLLPKGGRSAIAIMVAAAEAAAAAGAAGVGPVAARLPSVALSLGIGVAAALPAIFLDDLIALFAGGGTASGAALTRRAVAQPADGKVRS